MRGLWLALRWGLRWDSDVYGPRQPLRLARKGGPGEGDLLIGRIADSDIFESGLVLAVGHGTLPAGTTRNTKVRALGFRMQDGANTPEDWVRWLALVEAGANAIRRGQDVLAACDLAVSRSTVLACGIVSRLDGRPIDLTLVRSLRNTLYDDEEGGELLASETLWREASAALALLSAAGLATPPAEAVVLGKGS